MKLVTTMATGFIGGFSVAAAVPADFEVVGCIRIWPAAPDDHPCPR